MRLVKIICNAPGFRRAGRAWPAETVVDMDDFSPAEREAIEGEAQLQVRVLSKKEQDEHLQGMQALGDSEAPKSTTPPLRAPLQRRGTRKKTARKAS